MLEEIRCEIGNNIMSRSLEETHASSYWDSEECHT